MITYLEPVSENDKHFICKIACFDRFEPTKPESSNPYEEEVLYSRVLVVDSINAILEKEPELYDKYKEVEDNFFNTVQIQKSSLTEKGLKNIFWINIINVSSQNLFCSSREITLDNDFEWILVINLSPAFFKHMPFLFFERHSDHIIRISSSDFRKFTQN